MAGDVYRWKALDFAALKRSSVSFFNVEKPETAVSRWARARTRAAKVGFWIIQLTFWFFDDFIFVISIRANCLNVLQVGKGLSKDEKAQKLALQHWLEAVSFDIYEFHLSKQKFFLWISYSDI